jgi:hypothetical protein
LRRRSGAGSAGIGTDAVEAQQHHQRGQALIGHNQLARICGHDEPQSRI